MIGRADLTAALSALAAERPVFHAEADFQHALAWTVRDRHAGVEVRLERPVPLAGERGHVDIWLRGSDTEIVIELKYWTREAHLVVSDEEYELRQQGAQPPSRYDLWKDVARIERLIERGWATGGYVAALTNEQSYWNEGGAGAIDGTFRTHENNEVLGKLAWGPGAAAGTMKNREQPIELRGRYITRWQSYSQPFEAPGGEFRYLLLDVGEALLAATGRASP